jgi:recombination associated protein RdgC
MLNKATVFRFNTQASKVISKDVLKAKLKERPARECKQTEEIVFGWASFTSDPEDVLLDVGSASHMRLEISERKIPAKALKRELNKRVKQAEAKEGKRLKRDQKDEIIAQIKMEFLPKTIPTESIVTASIDWTESLLIVDESAKKAETLTTLLRGGLGSLPIARIGAEEDSHVVFSQMITEDLAIEQIEMGDTATLENMTSKEKVSISNGDLHCDEVKAHISSEMVPRKVRLHFGDDCSAQVSDDLLFSGIKISAAAKERQGYDDIEDEVSKIQADLFIWQSAVVQMLSFLNPGLKISPARP